MLDVASICLKTLKITLKKCAITIAMCIVLYEFIVTVVSASKIKQGQFTNSKILFYDTIILFNVIFLSWNNFTKSYDPFSIQKQQQQKEKCHLLFFFVLNIFLLLTFLLQVVKIQLPISTLFSFYNNPNIAR